MSLSGSDRSLKPGQRRWVQEVLALGWDFSDKPYGPEEMAFAMYLNGPKAQIFRMVFGRSPDKAELAAFRPTPEQAHDYLIRKLREGRGRAKAQAPKKPQPRTDLQVEALLRRYLQDFEAPTAADVAALRTLCQIEVRLRSLWDRLAREEDVQTAKLLSDEAVRLSQEHRQLQSALGIDRAARLRRDRESDPAEVIRETLEQAREMLGREVLVVEHCQTTLAWVWPAFPEAGYSAWFVCPLCAQRVGIPAESRAES